MDRIALVFVALAVACGSDSDTPADGGSSGAASSTGDPMMSTAGTAVDGSDTGGAPLPWPPACATADPPSCGTIEVRAICPDAVTVVDASVWETVYVDASPTEDVLLGESDVCTAPVQIVAESNDPFTGEAILASYAWTAWDYTTDTGFSYHCEAYRLLPASGYVKAGTQIVYELEGTDFDPRPLGDDLPNPPPMGSGNGCCLVDGVPLAGTEWEKAPCP